MASRMASSRDPALGPPYWHTLGVFAAAYGVLTLVLVAFFATTELPANTGASIGALMASALFAAQSFAKAVGRAPRGGEVWRLALGSFAIATVASIVLSLATALVLGGGVAELRELLALMQHELSGPGLFILIALVSLVHVLALWVAYGPLARFITSRAAKR